MKSYQLHAVPDRQAVFRQLSPNVWLEAELLRTWVIADPALILKIFRHPSAIVSSLPNVLNSIKEIYGQDLPNVAYACRVLPVLVDTEVHSDVRRGFARFVADNLSDLETRLPELARSSFAPLSKKGLVDIVSQVVDPFIQGIFSCLLKRHLPLDIMTLHVGDILSFNTILARLKTLESRIAKTRAFLEDSDDGEDVIAWKFTSMVFGLDSLAMMLTEALVIALNEAAKAPQEQAKLPEFPLETGVPITLRRADRDFEIDGHAFKSDDLLRLQLQSFGYSEIVENRKFIFGAGVHSCVGKQLTLRVWEHFRQEFDRLGLRARIREYHLIPSHFILLHKSVQVEVI